MIIALSDKRYPWFLRETGLYAPDELYCEGALPDPRQLMIAVIGTRRMSEYGKKATEKIVRGLVSKGFWIVSGLAHGVDSAAHAAAVAAGGNTVAVLGHGLSAGSYWGARARLFREIPKHGCILTEYPPLYPASKITFPKRNRIIAGLSVATVIIEAMERSGSFITALWSQIFNRDVFAVPGDIFYPRSFGTHRMIQKHMAYLATSAEDIVDELSLWIREKVSRDAFLSLTDDERLIFDELKLQAASPDGLTLATGLSVFRVSALLSQLELRGFVQSQGPLFRVRPQVRPRSFP